MHKIILYQALKDAGDGLGDGNLGSLGNLPFLSWSAAAMIPAAHVTYSKTVDVLP
jgi:hypothetical protein